MLEHVYGFRPNNYPGGMLRHQGAVTLAIALGLGTMALGFVDLKSLDESKAILDRNFKIALQPKQAELPSGLGYSDNNRESEGLCPVVQSSWTEGKHGFVDANGKLVIEPIFTSVYSFSEGLAAVQDSKSKNWGFIDKAGKYVIQPRYDSGTKFEHGVAPVMFKGKWQLIDKTGKVLYASESKAAVAELSAGLFTVESASGLVGMIDKHGKLVAPMEYSGIYELHGSGPDQSDEGYDSNFAASGKRVGKDQFFLFKKEGRSGVINAKGKVVIPAAYDKIVSFENGHAVFVDADKYGILDSAGKVVIEPCYDFVSAFDDLIVVRKGKKWSFIDSTGKPVAGPAFGAINTKEGHKWLSDGLGAILVGDKFGFVNSKGELVIKPQYDWVLSFREQCAPVLQNSHWHYIDLKGYAIGPTKIGNIAQFSSGHAEITVQGPMYAFMNFRRIDGENEALKVRCDWLRQQGGKSDASDTNEESSDSKQ